MEIKKEEETKLLQLQKILGITFKNTLLLKNALIHRSYLNESKQESLLNNEKLEYLGDAVLELVITEYLYNTFPERNEGELTSFRAATVRTESLADTALKLNIGEFIYMSKGEESTGGRKRPYILANTFEALLGATYLDQGLETVRVFVANNLFPKIKDIVEKRLDIDNKSKLQELSQEITGYTPVYEFISAKGPDHDKVFTMAVKIGAETFGEGQGRSKQEAEQKAAADALHNWDKFISKSKITKMPAKP